MQGKSLLFWPRALLLWVLIFFKLLECVLGFCNRRVGLLIDYVLAVVWVCIGCVLGVYWLCFGCIGCVLAGFWVSVMRALGWNCRGICNASTVRALRAQNRGHKPDIIFLCETKTNGERMDYVKRMVGFNENVVTEAKGRVGGLCLMWKNNVQIEVVEFNKYLIAVKILDPGGDWNLVGFYGPPYASKKRKAWENLCALLETFQEPWICFGDFNIVMDSEEKDGGRAECSMSSNFLKDILFELGAIDLGFSGIRFT